MKKADPEKVRMGLSPPQKAAWPQRPGGFSKFDYSTIRFSFSSLGKTRFRITATTKTTATQFSAKTLRKSSGKIWKICGVCVKPRPMLREGSDAHISLRVTGFSEHTDTGNNDRAEHHERAATENGIRKGRQDDAEAGDNACQNHKCRTASDSLTVYNLGHSDKTDILAEGCDRHAAEKGRQ